MLILFVLALLHAQGKIMKKPYLIGLAGFLLSY
jgi:hypothetical protein